MTDFTGRTPGSSYPEILSINNPGGTLDGTLRDIQGSTGTLGPFLLSTSGVRLKNGTTLDGLSGSTIDFTNIDVTAPKGWELVAQNSPTGVNSFQVTGIPASANAILIVFDNVDYALSDRSRVRVLDAGTPETTNYFSSSVFFNNSTTPSVGVSTTGFDLVRQNNTSGTNTHAGVALLTKNGTTGIWNISSLGRYSDTTTPTNYMWSHTIGQSPVVAGTMDGVEILTNGSNNFTAGTFSVYSSGA